MQPVASTTCASASRDGAMAAMVSPSTRTSACCGDSPGSIERTVPPRTSRRSIATPKTKTLQGLGVMWSTPSGCATESVKTVGAIQGWWSAMPLMPVGDARRPAPGQGRPARAPLLHGGGRHGHDASMSVERSLHQLDLNLLLPLDALLTERHVTRAAARLHLGQSGMSAALSRLRRFFDDELLVRNGNALDLTPLAQALVSPVREAITSVERLLTTRPHFDPAVDSRTFRVIASDYMTLVLLRPLLARLFADAPS